MKFTRIASIIVFSMLCAAPASAQSEWSSEALGCSLDVGETTDEVFARLKGTMEDRSKCSAALVTVKGRASTEKAWMLGAAHCTKLGSAMAGHLRVPAPKEVLHRINLGGFQSTLDTGNRKWPRICVNTSKLLYATLTDTDLALYELVETYDAIKSKTGVEPLLISADKELAPGSAIVVPSPSHRKAQACAIEKKVHVLKESEWQWRSTVRMSADCKIVPGDSGSAVIKMDTGEIIGVLGTAYRGQQACDLNNPCEIDEAGQTSTVAMLQGYFHTVHGLHACLDGNLNFDLNAPGCPLLKPQQ